MKTDDDACQIFTPFAPKCIQGLEIEIQLASIFRPKRPVLQLDRDVAMKLEVVEEQVDIEFLATDLEMILLADEGEPLAEFEHELGDMLDQFPLDLPLVGLVAQV